MTYILGSRCKDGIVLIADRKFTVAQEGNFLYDDKLYAEIEHVITGFAGSRGLFELFRAHLVDKIITYNNTYYSKGMPVHKLIIVMSETMATLHKDHYKDSFEALIAFGNPEGKAYLKYFLRDGGIETISQYKSIGNGSSKGEFFLKELWNPEITMQKVAEIGYFIIKYIEKFNLDYTVGVGESKPQIWFIPDNSVKDYPMSQEDLENLENKTCFRLDNLDTFIKKLI